MARILEKAFDATKKIVRTVFLGSPNLFTTSDLNRQFEQIQCELEGVQRLIGVNSDFSVTHVSRAAQGTGVSVEAHLSLTFVKANGSSFSPTYNQTEMVKLDFASSPRAYFLLVAKKKTITYADDFSHEIAGARFEDNTSKAAANQIVYYGERIVVSKTLSYKGYEVVGILGYLEYKAQESVIFYSTCYKDYDNIMQVVNEVKALRSVEEIGVSDELAVGDSYGVVIRKIKNVLSLFKTNEVNTCEIADVTIPSDTGLPFETNRIHIWVKGRNIFVDMLLRDLNLGTYTSMGWKTLFVGDVINSNFWNLINTSSVQFFVCREPIWNFDGDSSHTYAGVSGVYVSFHLILYKKEAANTVHYEFRSYVEGLFGRNANFDIVDLRNKVLRAANVRFSTEHYCFRLPDY